eukprot:TRINITY_DN1762_c0_g1_i1.p1 TRINITY_DN1762_c0_g1~~TRINITY_DN1762_c0_g1_i1.p1  ORF type:complete len:314 (-),score=77.83 TRINITY_DN1762_c0_g1_i1:97-1038(-)
MPPSSRPLLEALQIIVPLGLLDGEVDVAKLRLAQYQRNDEDMDQQLKEVAERRRLKAAAAAAAAEAATSPVPALGTQSQKQKPKEKLTAQRQLQPMRQQEASEMTDKPQKRSHGKGRSEGKEGRMRMSGKMSKKHTSASQAIESWNSSWQGAEGNWEMHPTKPIPTCVDHQLQEMCGANGQSQQQQQHTQQHDSPARYDRTPSPESRAMPPTMEGFVRMEKLLHEARWIQHGKQYQQERQSWQSWKTYDDEWSKWSRERDGHTENTVVQETGVDCQRVLNEMLGKQLHLTQFEPIEYGVRGSAGMQCNEDMYE